MLLLSFCALFIIKRYSADILLLLNFCLVYCRDLVSDNLITSLSYRHLSKRTFNTLRLSPVVTRACVNARAKVCLFSHRRVAHGLHIYAT